MKKIEKSKKQILNIELYKNITLKEFQSGIFKIPVNEHIWYINNYPFYQKNWHYYLIEPWNFKINIPNKVILDLLKKTYHYGRIFLQFIKTSYLPYRIPNQNLVIFLGWKNKDFSGGLNELFSVFKRIKERQKKYVVVIGKCYRGIDNNYIKDIPDNIKNIFANNVNVSHSKIVYLPLGRDFRSSHLFDQVNPEYEKKYLCYCNFSLNTHEIRQNVFDSIKIKNFIEFEHMGKFRQYSIERIDFYKKVSLSKFVICPRGKGIDTFRLWDCLYLGAIPIVVKEAAFHETMKDLPILFLDSYSDYAKLTEDFLNETYLKMLNKEFDYRKLFISFWLNKINESFALCN